jgi:predicted secreted protein
VAGAQQGYKVQYRVVGAPSWIVANSLLATVSVSNLAPATAYEWQLQTKCSNTSLSAFSALSTFTTTNTIATIPTPVCSVPLSLSATNITGTSATLQWMGSGFARNYNLQYREVGASSWITLSSMQTSVNILGLNPSSNYEWQVQNNCGNTVTSSYSAVSTFSTPGVPVCGQIPTSLTVAATTPNSATLTWSVGANAAMVSGYEVRYREMLTQAWSSVITTSGSVTLTSLSSTAAYEWQVRTDCGGAGLSPFSPASSFSMLGHVAVNTTQSFDANQIPNPQDPNTWNVIIASSGNAATDAQIVHDWLVAHGCIVP